MRYRGFEVDSGGFRRHYWKIQKIISEFWELDRDVFLEFHTVSSILHGVRIFRGLSGFRGVTSGHMGVSEISDGLRRFSAAFHEHSD